MTSAEERCVATYSRERTTYIHTHHTHNQSSFIILPRQSRQSRTQLSMNKRTRHNLTHGTLLSWEHSKRLRTLSSPKRGIHYSSFTFCQIPTHIAQYIAPPHQSADTQTPHRKLSVMLLQEGNAFKQNCTPNLLFVCELYPVTQEAAPVQL